MHIFIDESGIFTGYGPNSIHVVGALAIPDRKLKMLRKRVAKFRKLWAAEKGELKGGELFEWQINEIVRLLARHETVFEASAVDLSIHNEKELLEFKERHAQATFASAKGYDEPRRSELRTGRSRNKGLVAATLRTSPHNVRIAEPRDRACEHVLFAAEAARIGVLHVGCRWKGARQSYSMGTVVGAFRARGFGVACQEGPAAILRTGKLLFFRSLQRQAG